MSKKEPKSPAERAKDYRERKKQASIGTGKLAKRDRDSQIQTIKTRLEDTDLPPKVFASLTHQLALLTGAVETYKAGKKPEPEPPIEEQPLPRDWDFWWPIWMIELLANGTQNKWAPRLLKMYEQMSPEDRAVCADEVQKHRAMCARIRMEQEVESERSDLLQKLGNRPLPIPETKPFLKELRQVANGKPTQDSPAIIQQRLEDFYKINREAPMAEPEVGLEDSFFADSELL